MYVREISDGLYTAFTYLLYKARNSAWRWHPHPASMSVPAVVSLSLHSASRWMALSHSVALPVGHCRFGVTVAAPLHKTHVEMRPCLHSDVI